ncbi:Conserved oligomeric Golgi complex subunit 3 [Phlyctema vagabunda]|uniref:Conserved oligomeric Golgi complex subunit 3 n=1 Tax=Phlyctema vagabunda TaxID=108571 RepID=A0ABR4PSF2_9HELO
MYEDSWYSFQPEEKPKKDELVHHHHRRESLLKQANGSAQISESSAPVLELFEDSVVPKGPPKATLARRAKSYSDFYHVARSYIRKEVAQQELRDPFEISEHKINDVPFEARYDQIEESLLDASQEMFQLYKEQLVLAEQHLDNLCGDTTSALDLLATLSDSFKAVDSQTTAFQSQCEGLLTEQKRLRTLADEVGIDLQYYGYLEPLTRRLNAPGAGRLIKAADFVEILTNLNSCIEFMDQHPGYRDSATYKTRYVSLLDKALDLVYVAVSKSLRDISDSVSKQLNTADSNETKEYALLYGSYENVLNDLGDQVETILTSAEFAFRDEIGTRPYESSYNHLFDQTLDEWIRSRSAVTTVIQKNLQKFAAGQQTKQKSSPTQRISDTDFQSLARRCIQYVFEMCDNERKLLERVFLNGPLQALYSTRGPQYVEKLEQNRILHITSLYNFLKPHLASGTMHQARDLVSWVETMYMVDAYDEVENGRRYSIKEDSERYLRQLAEVLLNEHLWDFQDSLFLAAANELQTFKPSSENLKVNGASATPSLADKVADPQTLAGLGLTKAYPTVKVAVNLLVMYNDNKFERPPQRREKMGNVLYEIVHQTTESLQRAATIIKRETNIMDAQIFLIKNLILIENLFLTHEIPDSVRQSPEFDFSPIWTTIRELQDRRQLLNPLAYFTPLLQGKLLPAVKEQLLDARKELERVLVQQITAFTKHWQSRLRDKNTKKGGKNAADELEILLEKSFDDETTRNALLKMIYSEE